VALTALIQTLRRNIDLAKSKGSLLDSRYVWTQERQVEYQSKKIEELLSDPYFLGERARYLYPKHRDDIVELWRRRKEGTYVFADCTGIGGGKTYKAGILMWLLALEVLTDLSFGEKFQLDPDSKTALIVTSRDASKAKEVTFRGLLPFFNCGIVKDYFRPNVDFDTASKSRILPNTLRFAGSNFLLFPGTGQEASALGFNLYGGIMDEVNYMTVVDESKRSRTGRNYDAAKEIYSAVESRMQSRFLVDQQQHGLLVMLSNPRYAGDFLERMRERARHDKSVMFVSRTTWDAQPESKHSNKKFRFCIDSLKIVRRDEAVSGQVIDVPIDWESDFVKNPVDSWRRLGNTPIQSITPFFWSSENLIRCIDTDRENPFDERLRRFKTWYKCTDKFQRFVHIDLGRSHDCGTMSMGYANGVLPLRVEDETSKDLVLSVVIDFVVKIDPKELNETIDFKIFRELIYDLTERGFEIALVTYDKFQSMESIDRLREKGYVVENLSIDRTSHRVVLSAHEPNGVRREPTGKRYTAAMDAVLGQVNAGALSLPEHYWNEDSRMYQFVLEALSLERLSVNGEMKVVPAVGARDDVAQTIAGTVFNCVSNIHVDSFSKEMFVKIPKALRGDTRDSYQKLDDMLSGNNDGDFETDDGADMTLMKEILGEDEFSL